ncbi:MAG: hypothetical protein IPK27_01170 [Rhodanobacteraceae bacterium]|nr:hypothetical protein [Rhodanobacteraceae bacterium]
MSLLTCPVLLFALTAGDSGPYRIERLSVDPGGRASAAAFELELATASSGRTTGGPYELVLGPIGGTEATTPAPLLYANGFE